MTGAGIEDIYPLSALQQGILFHALYAPDSGFYFQQLGWELSGDFDGACLRRAWARVIERHAVLRSAFLWKGRKEPLQVVMRAVALPWSEIDWSGLDPARQERQLENLLAADRRAGFRLDRAPLLRLRLMTLGAGRYRFLWSYHHLLLDGWSVALALSDLFEVYRAGREGRQERLPAVRRFGEYIAWLQSQDRQAAEEFWRRTLAGLGAPPALPQRLSFGPARQGFAELQRHLGPQVTARLRQLARQTRTTLNLVMQAAWALLLHHYTGALDLLFGATLSGRSAAPEAWSHTVGVLVNTVPIRVQVSPEQSLEAWLRQLQEWQLEVFSFEHTPLVDVQRWSEVPAGTPLFESLLAFENFPVEASLAERADDRLTLHGVWSYQKPHYPLALMAAAPDDLSLRLLFDLSRFDPATASRLLQHLAALLAACADAAPDGRRRLEELQPLTAAERQQLIAEWNDTAAPVGLAAPEPPEDAGECLHDLFARRAALAPDAVAVNDGRHVVTYGRLAARAGQLAARLAAHGVRAGDFVAVFLDRDVEMVAALLAILRTGAAYVPIEPALPPPRVLAILSAVTTRGAITSPALLSRLAGLLPALPHPVAVVLTQSPAAADPEEVKPALPSALPSAPSSAPPVPAAAAPPRVDPGSFAYVIFTSGSSGAPKGVAVRHRQAVNLVRWVNRTFAVGAGDRVLMVASLSFDLSVYDIFGLLAAGGAVRLATEAELAEPARLVDLLVQGQANLWDSAPAALQQLVPLLPRTAPAAALRLVLLSGDWVPLGLPAQTVAAFPAARVVALGGATEAVIWSNFFPLGDLDPRWVSIPYGRPIQKARYHVLDPCFRPCAIGVEGDLYIGGDCLAWGYWGDPALTAEKFRPDPFAPAPGAVTYKTGDRARYLPDGNLEFLGRRDQQVKVRGFRVETGEVEAALREHPGVLEVVVLARGADRSDRQLAAFYLAAQSPPPGAAELRDFVAARLPRYMVPAQFVEIEQFPATANGKLDRRALAAWAPSRTASGAAPGAPLEELVAGLWEEVLEVPAVRRGDDFFALGGHSLLATRLLSRLRQVLGVELSLRTLFEQPSLGDMLVQIEAALGAPRDHLAQPITPLAPGEEPPLSFSQERLWFLDQLEPGGAAYNIPFVCRLRGALSLPALAAALQEVVRRHQVLRATFASRGGKAVQTLASAARLAVRLVDLAGLAAAARQSQAQALAVREAALPFDLTRGPLLRATLARLGPDEHQLLVTMHHIVSDGWSITIFVREVAALYQAGVAGLPSPFVELPVQYGDFARWQRQWLQGEALAALAGRWRQRLGEAPASLELPLDRPRPARASSRAATVVTLLEPRLSQQLVGLGRGAGATLFMTLLAAFLVQLGRLAGQRDLCVGTPIAGRNRSEIENLIGFFVNTLALRVDLAGAPTFLQLLARVREVALDAYVHQDLPFEKLVEELHPRRSLRRTPFFQVFFNMLNLPVEDIHLPGLVIEPVAAAGAAAKFDLTLYAAERDGRIWLEWSYRADLFDAGRVAEMARQLAALLEQAAAEPEAGIGAYSLLTAAARAVLPDPAAVLGAPAADETVDRRFAAAARRAPDAVAVVDAEGFLTYGRLDRESGLLAAALRAEGVAAGDLVAIDAAAGAPLVVALLGIVKAGAAFVIVDRQHPAARLAASLQAARPAAWIDLTPARPPRVRADLPRRARPAMPAHPVVPAGLARQGGDLAYLIFTSGSSGAPRGILGGHGPLAHFLGWHAATFGLTAADRFAMLSGLAHDPLLRDVFTPLGLGATLCVPPPGVLRDPAPLRRWLGEEEVSVLHLTPGLADLLCAGTGAACEAPLSLPALPALRHAFFGGERLTHGHVARLRHLAPRVSCANFYGASETPQAMAWQSVAPAAAEAAAAEAPAADLEAVPIGRGIDGVQLLVAAAAGQAGIGEAGEIHIRTPHLALGYLDDAAATAERFTPDPASDPAGGRLYRTGDLGRYRCDGSVDFLGRVDDQANVRGVRVEPAEVAAALAQHPGVRQAYVLARPAEPAGGGDAARLVAWFVAAGEPAPASPPTLPALATFPASPPTPSLPTFPASSTSPTLPTSPPLPTPRELRRHLLARLPEAMVPQAFIQVAELPLTANGKFDRRRLLDLAASAPAVAAAAAAPLTPAREVVAAVWGELLPARPIGADADFFELGGHSLLATQVVSRLRAALGVDVSLLDLFATPTVAGLAQTLEARLRGGTLDAQPPIHPVARDQALPLSAAQRRLWFLDRLHPGDPSYNVPSALRLRGDLDVAALAATLAALVRRHESLRTRFVEAAGRPLQEVAPAFAVALPVVDLRALGGERREREAARVGRALVRAPFDLRRAPLLRCLVVRLDATEQAAFFAMHHIVSDGWSMGILVREIAALYRERVAGGTAGLAPLPVQYADFAHWQQAQARGAEQERQLAYWLDQIQGAPPLVELPVDRPRPPLQSHRGATLRWRFSPALRAGLRELQRRERVTLFMILLAGFQALLHWYRGQDDFVLGTDVANRTRLEVEGLIGCFVNQLPLRARFAGVSTFAQLLRQAAAATLGAYAHQDLPYDNLVESLRLPRSLAYPPIIQAKINLYNFPLLDLALPGLAIEPWEMGTESAKLDLIVDLLDTEVALQGSCHYCTDLFDAATIERLWRHFELLLERVAAQPEVRLDELASMLGAADRERQVEDLGRFRESRGRLLRQRAGQRSHLSPVNLEKEGT